MWIVGEERRSACRLVDGICRSDDCAGHDHGDIVMTDEWIQSHPMEYLMAMIRLRVHLRRKYVKGACAYITKHPSMAKALDYRALIKQYQQKNVRMDRRNDPQVSLAELKSLLILNESATLAIIEGLAESNNNTDITLASGLVLLPA